ncbi:MAG TPA: 30S ribosomal protein S6 [Planctomycetes bacterium]|nr:30S ribosomal protein S6 [Planctomycetota bacterium]HIJ71247.1 30S ribosomal protein S6 [Planctomycetota bacterium]
MSTNEKRLYEGLFLVDSGEAAADWKGINDAIEKILARGDAEIVSSKKWDERRLAYDINGKSRGTYILTYFRGDPAGIGAIERSVQLSERIMRMLIIRTDKMSAEDMEKTPPATTESSDVATGRAKPASARAETKALKKSATKSKARGRAKASKKTEDKKPKTTKAKESPGSSAERSSSPPVRRKTTKETELSTEPESKQATE